MVLPHPSEKGWRDGREQHIGHVLLREQCPCSQCRAFRLSGITLLVAPTLELVEVHSQGYGLQMLFSDGHQRGIYP
ncbi:MULTISPECIES: gamma-butyrobetaine hydroxylase-like domain-containing protein [unclassified Pseudomonas]|uniref:gamma-butyrobetaine hydroxylase-like domain-containing protein n=1 Tax=unclassified Pseudomonas TaxID=196821 RepID=UPI0025F100F5|nr:MULTISPECIES: gamma-butyrobetaine hydroxylase-like domain-containing protein [unclassified Pseudomonas]